MMRTAFRNFTTISPLLFLWAASGCDDDDSVPVGGGGQGAGGGASTTASPASTSGAGGAGGGSGLEVTWTPCPLSSDDTTGDDALCSTTKVPLDWSDPSGPTIDFFVKKIPAAEQPPRGQLWLLNGGPGYSGADFEGAFVAQTYDLYLPDHRGTGRSSRLGCPEAESDASPGGFWVTDEELPGCVPGLLSIYGDTLAGYTTTNAARDVGEVIEAIRNHDELVIVLGASYGSTWGNRYLQIYPEQADGAMLDAFAVDLKMTRDDWFFNALGQRWMQACALEPTCSQKLGADPWATMTQAIESLESGGCPEIAAQGWSRSELHVFWSFFFYTWEYRSLIAPMVYRLARCEPRDVDAFQTLHDVFTQPQEPTAAQRYFSMMLSTHVMLSELWEDPPPPLAELQDYQASANVAHGLAAPAQGVYDVWPRYEKDGYVGGLGVTDKPVLMMRGQYDFIPIAEIQPVIDHYLSQNGTFVEIPNAPHSPYAAPTEGGGPSCAGQVLGQFLAEPTATIDTSCTSTVAPLPFDVSSPLSNAAFGANDEWDGPTVTVAPLPSSVAVDRERLRRRFAAAGLHRQLGRLHRNP